MLVYAKWHADCICKSLTITTADPLKTQMKLTFLGANRQVTGSRYCLEASGTKIMIDCGMVQEREFLARNWDPCPIPCDAFSAMVLTHVHIDHSGLIPKFVRDGFQGPIYATAPSVDLVDIMLLDSARIQEEDARYKKRRHEREGRQGKHPEVPLYTEKDAVKALRQFKAVEYETPIKVNDAFTVTFHDAGHILGSACVQVVATENGMSRTFLFSGDLGQWNRPLMNDPTTFDSADYVVMESTYGDREHKDAGDIGEQMAEIINRTVERGGNVVIPTFAVERAQELTYHISRLIHHKKIPVLPVYLDSPMAVDVTKVFRRNVEYMDDKAKEMAKLGVPPMGLPEFINLVSSVEGSKAINTTKEPSIIMSASGMCNAGRIKHHLRNNISNQKNTILFVGFQARGTLGRQVLEGSTKVRIHGQMRKVRAEIAQIFGFSGHADRTDLLQWLGSMGATPRQVFLTHGEEASSLALSKQVEEKLRLPVIVPAYGESYEFDLSEEAADAVSTRSAKSVLDAAHPPMIALPREVAEMVKQIEGHADTEFLNSPLSVPADFIHEDPWRVLRIQSDAIQGVEMMTRALQGCKRSVAVFGSARTDSMSETYKLAVDTTRQLGESGFAIITGGGPGIMEAANRGAREAKAHSIALNISLSSEQQVNPYVDFHYTCHYFFVRKMMFVKYAQAFIIFPGGFGTLDELFESLTLIQTGKLNEFPVVLVGSDYWNPLIRWLQSETFHRGFIDADDMKRLVVVDTAEEIVKLLAT